MLQGFPAETGVVRVKKGPPKLEGFHSEKARALDKLLALDKALTLKKELAAQKAAAGRKAPRRLTGARQLAVDALRRSQLAISGLRRPRLAIDGVGLALDGLRRSMTFAAPVLTVLAAIALSVVAIASWRAAPATASIQPVQESTDIVLPAAQSAQAAQADQPANIMLPAQPLVASQLRVQREVNLPAVADPKIAIRDIRHKSARAGEMATPSEAEPTRVSTVGNFNEAQSVATSLEALPDFILP
jgi:hypothetical protein